MNFSKETKADSKQQQLQKQHQQQQCQQFYCKENWRNSIHTIQKKHANFLHFHSAALTTTTTTQAILVLKIGGSYNTRSVVSPHSQKSKSFFPRTLYSPKETVQSDCEKKIHTNKHNLLTICSPSTRFEHAHSLFR